MTMKRLSSITVILAYLGVPTLTEMEHMRIILNAYGKYMHNERKLSNCLFLNSTLKRIPGVVLIK